MKIFLTILFLLSSIADASASQSGFSYNNKCYPTTTDANNAFIASFPRFQASNTVTLYTTNPPTVDGNGLITYSFYLHPIGGTAAGYTGYTLQLMPCDYEQEGWGSVSQSALLYYSSLMVLFFIGARMGFIV